MKILRYGDGGFDAQWAALVERSDSGEDGQAATIAAVATGIVDDVRDRGDAALIEQTARLDRWQPPSAAALTVPPDRLEQAWDGLATPLQAALKTAHQRVTAYHERQRAAAGWEGELIDGDGVRVGWRTRALRTAGVYVPGGTAAYPSSVLMNVVPAKVAGVGEVVMVSPTPDGVTSEVAWAAAHLAGAHRVLRVGGAQAIAALAYGTASVPRCDVIVGPGNAWVAAAKRLVGVRGRVAVDMEAGPSEVLIVGDVSADPEHIAADLLAQAEHDPRAVPGLILVDAADREAAVVDPTGRELSRHPTLGYDSVIDWPTDLGPQSLVRREFPVEADGEHRVLWVDPTGRELGRFDVRASYYDRIQRFGLDQYPGKGRYFGTSHVSAIGDVDGDGREELLVTDRETVWLFKND